MSEEQRERSGAEYPASKESGIDPELAALKKRKLQLMRTKLELMDNYGLAYYKPHALQDAFHRAGNKKARLWEAGNRGGKTTGGAAEDSSWCMGYRPFYPVGDPARTLGIPQNEPVRGLIVCNDLKKVGETFTGMRGDEGKLWRLFPRGFARPIHTTDGVVDKIACQNESVLNFATVRAWMTNPGSVESTNYHFAHFDEPLPKAMWKAVIRGLMDSDGSQWFTLTPKSEPWIHNEFFPARLMKQTLIEHGRKWGQRSSTLDNPYLPRQAVADFEASLTRDERECMIHGIPLQLSGLVYKEFSFDKHVLSTPIEGWASLSDPPRDATIYVAMDVHPQTPHHIMFLAMLPHDVAVVYDEIFLHCTTSELAHRILDKLKGRFYTQIICDPLAFIKHPILGISMADDFAANGLYVGQASKARAQGILRGKEWLLRPNGFFVTENCEETVNEFANHAWDTKLNKPKDEDDHAMENFGRLAIERPRWVDQTARPVSLPPISFDVANLGELDDLSNIGGDY